MSTDMSDEVIYTVCWKDYAMNSYLYGSCISFYLDDIVNFKNRLMPSGVAIKEWYSVSDYQSKRVEPMLPLLKEKVSYTLRGFYSSNPDRTVLIRLDFYNRQGENIGFRVMDTSREVFEYPEGAFRYTMQLVQVGSSELIFHHIEIAEEKVENRTGVLLNKREDCRKGYVFFPHKDGRLIVLPKESAYRDLANVMIAPSDVYAPEAFAQKDWTEPLRREAFEQIVLCVTDARMEAAAQRLKESFPESEVRIESGRSKSL